MRHRALPCLLLLPLTAQFACGDKPDDTGGPPGGGGDGGAEDCTLELAPAGKVEADPTCEAVVDRLLGISVDWQWTGAEGYESFNTVITTPVVGDVDGDGHPEIVVTVTDPAYHFAGGVLAVIDGVTGDTDLLLGDVDGATISDTGGVALADLDGDGTPEILVLTMDSTIAAVHADGEVLWESAPQSSVLAVYTHLGAADFDGDGLSEVWGGGAIFGADGGFEQASDGAIGSTLNMTVVADLEGDGQLALVAGNQAFDLDGNLLWDRSEDLPDFAPAVADFDGDGKGEVVGVDYASWQILMLDGDGSTLWGPDKFVGAAGGPPCVADFDGDGGPEIAAVGYKQVAMYDADGTVLWSHDVSDGYYGANGCSAFDFDDDGAYELVYADNAALYVEDGVSGQALFSATDHAGISISGYPVIVDVDADGRTEIVLGSNQLADSSAWGGITVLNGIHDSWSPTRQVWNQHAYWGGNILDDLTVPADPAMPWEEGHNSFRAGIVFDRGEPTAPGANIVATASDTCIECSAGLVRFEVAVQISNQGAVDVEEDIPVGIYAVTDTGRRELIETHLVEGGLPAGRSSAAFEVSGQFATSVGFTSLEAQVDGHEIREDLGILTQRAYLDCNADDDVVSIPFGCDE